MNEDESGKFKARKMNWFEISIVLIYYLVVTTVLMVIILVKPESCIKSVTDATIPDFIVTGLWTTVLIGWYFYMFLDSGERVSSILNYVEKIKRKRKQ